MRIAVQTPVDSVIWTTVDAKMAVARTIHSPVAKVSCVAMKPINVWTFSVETTRTVLMTVTARFAMDEDYASWGAAMTPTVKTVKAALTMNA